MLAEVPNPLGVYRETGFAVEGRLDVAHRLDHLPGSVDEHIRRFPRVHAAEQVVLGTQDDAKQQPRQSDAENRPGDPGSRHAFPFCRCHDCRQGCFAGRERRGQRVSAGQRCQNGERGSRAQCRISLETAQHDPLHDGIEVRDVRRGARRRNLEFQALDLRGAPTGQRGLPGKQFVQDEAQ